MSDIQIARGPRTVVLHKNIKNSLGSSNDVLKEAKRQIQLISNIRKSHPFLATL